MIWQFLEPVSQTWLSSFGIWLAVNMYYKQEVIKNKLRNEDKKDEGN